jgi:hypothetical protein
MSKPLRILRGRRIWTYDRPAAYLPKRKEAQEDDRKQDQPNNRRIAPF